MSRHVMTRSAGLPPLWKSVLAVTSHPDDEPFGLGGVMDAFIVAGVRVRVLCLTHGQDWTLHSAPGDLAALRGAELASAADVLGPVRAQMQAVPDGSLSEVGQMALAAGVVVAAESFHPDGLLVFDASGVNAHDDHVAAKSAVLLAAEMLDLPVLGWTLSKTVAAQLNQELGAGATADPAEEIDLRLTLARARQRLASRENAPAGLPGSPRCRRLELLAESESLRWLWRTSRSG